MRLGPLALAGVAVAGPLGAQTGPADPLLFRVDTRIGFLVTGAGGFADRPLFQTDGGVQLGRARPGGPPAVGLTLGTALASGELFAEGASVSLRVLGGVEFPWALGSGTRAQAPVELVPVFQMGYQIAFQDDRRRGFTARTALGLRIVPSRGTFFTTFEPFSLVWLPQPGRGRAAGSRWGLEVGVLKVGWRF